MARPKDDEVPRWKQDQVERCLNRVEADSALVGQDIVAEAEGESIERLIQECEKKGLEQWNKRAKKRCGEGGGSHVAVRAAWKGFPSRVGLRGREGPAGFGWKGVKFSRELPVPKSICRALGVDYVRGAYVG